MNPVANFLDPLRHSLVRFGDLAQVAGAGDQFLVVAGAEDEAGSARRAAFVNRHQAIGERPQGATQTGAFAAAAVRGRGRARALSSAARSSPSASRPERRCSRAAAAAASASAAARRSREAAAAQLRSPPPPRAHSPAWGSKLLGAGGTGPWSAREQRHDERAQQRRRAGEEKVLSETSRAQDGPRLADFVSAS